MLLAAGTAQALPFDFDGDDPDLPTHYVSVQTGVNLGMIELSIASGHFVAAVSTSPGWAVVSNGQEMAADFRAGYSWALSPEDETMWFFDLVVDAIPARVGTSFGRQPNEGLLFASGLAIGFRYVHRSGLVLGFRLPILGLAFGDWISGQHDGNFDFGTSMGGWYLALGLSSSLFTLGLRF